MSEIIVVEIPKEGDNEVWVASCAEELIEKAREKYGLIFNKWSLGDAIETFGIHSMPKTLREALDEGSIALEIGDQRYKDFYPSNPSKDDYEEIELESAREIIELANKDCFFLDPCDLWSFRCSQYEGVEHLVEKTTNDYFDYC